MLLKKKKRHGGIQYLHKFENGYGASVIRNRWSRGFREGLWELAIVYFREEESGFDLVYDTHITDDVLGYLTEEEVSVILVQVANLPKRTC